MKSTRRDFLKSMGIGASAVALSGSLSLINCQLFKKSQPNIVIIFTDDQGYAKLPFHSDQSHYLCAQKIICRNLVISGG
ncbi:MAG: twin-arginine translocation signal domain-containing protein [Calditrichae bacterium]|nr:twin-arginine translocation signal domain-containing protein [Calditrichia bacterium]